MIEPKEKFIQEVCCLERAIEIAKSIRDLWIETYEDKVEGEYGVSFGSEKGYVIYNYSSGHPIDIVNFLKEV